MKANEAPIKIWLSDEWVHQFDDKDFMGEDNIEYTRTDAFIEKALEFLDGCIPDYIDLKHANVDNKRFIEEFINYMKGEKV